MIKINIPGQPQGKARARAYKNRAGKIRHYTPAETRSYERIIANLAKFEMRGKPPMTGAVILEVLAVYEIPQSWPLWKRALAKKHFIAPTVKPDLDNVVKSVKDGLNKVAWDDDTQVIQVIAEKCYGETPCLVIEISAAENIHPASIKHQIQGAA